jgi:hypothetical protein
MMKPVLFASLVASAAAFAPAANSGTKSTAVSAAKMADMAGSINFAAKEMKFDPLKLSETYEPLLPFFREAELKHGRTAMLAVPGWIVADLGVRLPGDQFSVANVPSSREAHDLLLTGPMVFLLLCVGLFDLTAVGPGVAASMKGEREPGGKYLFWNCSNALFQ